MSNYDKWNRILKEFDDEEAAEVSRGGDAAKATKPTREFPPLSHKPLQLKQEIQEASAKLHALEKDLAEYDALAGVLKDLPTKLDHDIMVPLGKQAFVPGKIVHANEITAHLGGDLFAKQTASQTGAMVERKKTDLVKQIKHQEVWLESLHAKLGDVDNVLNLKKIYEDANIQEIKESEAESNEGIVDPSEFTQADYDMYFEIENQEAAKQAASSWDWDDAMRRMEALEQHEEASVDKTAVTTHEAESIKQQGNAAFASAKYQAAVDLYSKAIALTPTAHTLYGNRSAAHFHLREFAHAQKDADAAIAINPTWAKGHFRRGQALAALGHVDLAADAYEEASKLKPSDKSALALAKQLRQQADNDKNLRRLSTTHDVDAARRSSVFSGSVVETNAGPTLASPHQGQAQDGLPPPKRVSRFKALRQGLA
ncbi:prefoldin, alpha subunit, variant 1 [Aphanomyces astaci]|uniref:Prefoldin, alpha subunit, variant 1 n=1 Tax=Aphanomyces astaci TaxID=112090 RepID=W4GSR7_APHAT|nr:prefoldin, alpha subunit, variant 1 [Aphanomyces astaci]ETV82742.1 prefoldin, alpha subunit, variant 1 [Aphanomyces astaci]|eukprot:XP_009827413.1 prefoldin, alpha subunit, variant 1 [Aphanomyces astaci]